MTLDKLVEWLDLGPGTLFEDWGCGIIENEIRPLVRGAKYVGVDARPGEGVDVVANLAYHRSAPDSVLIKHVLSGHDWALVLQNAVRRFGRRLVVVEHPEVRSQSDVMYFSSGLTWRVEPFLGGSLCYLFERRPVL